MSLLADLLSKNKATSSTGGSDTPPVLNIPPTLTKASGITANVRKLNNRYVITAAVIIIFTATGALIAAKFEMFGLSKKRASPTPAVSLQQIAPLLPPIVPTEPLEQAKTARINLEEPPPLLPQKKRSRSAKEVTSHQQVQKVEHPPKQRSAQLQQKVTPTPPVDTAARDSFLYAARSAELTGDWRTALANYRKAQKIDPDSYVIMNNTAAALNNLGMFDAGVQEAERALAKKPGYVPALINAAIGYSSNGNTRKAVRLFTSASAFDPGNRSLVINLGILHERSGDLDAAQATYRQLAEEGDPLALQGMGRVYERKGNRLESVRAYRQIMALPNASPELKKDVKRSLVRLEE